MCMDTCGRRRHPTTPAQTSRASATMCMGCERGIHTAGMEGQMPAVCHLHDDPRHGGSRHAAGAAWQGQGSAAGGKGPMMYAVGHMSSLSPAVCMCQGDHALRLMRTALTPTHHAPLSHSILAWQKAKHSISPPPPCMLCKADTLCHVTTSLGSAQHLVTGVPVGADVGVWWRPAATAQNA